MYTGPIPTITAAQFAKIESFVTGNEKIKAIKEMREASRPPEGGDVMGLKDAKELIEDWPSSREKLLRQIKRIAAAGVAKVSYINTRESNIKTLMELGELDFDTESLELLEKDLNTCSEHLLRWLVYRLSLKEIK